MNEKSVSRVRLGSGSEPLDLRAVRHEVNVNDTEVIAAIRACHLKANISNPCYVRHHWDRARLDPGGTIFGPGPYVKLPVDWLVRDGSDETTEVTIRVYAPARLRRRLQRAWTPSKAVAHLDRQGPDADGR